MRIFTTISIVAVAGLLLLLSPWIVQSFEIRLLSHSFVNDLAKHQVFALVVALATMVTFIKLNPDSKQFLSIGNLHALAVREKWLGIDGRSSWLKNGLQLMAVISLATGIFMFLGVKQMDKISNFHGWFIPVALLLSFTNSFSEEIIFRFGVIAGLERHCSKLSILIISAILFGIPHYFGNPSGPIGVIMAGVLGYILCKASIETRGISIAWVIHFVQDVIIFTAILMMKV